METAFVRIQKDILRATDNQEVTILLLLDLFAAFDTVNHAGNALGWFVSYLKERQQSTIINNASSQFTDIKFGVPQGSVLGSILFSLYMHACTYIMYVCIYIYIYICVCVTSSN